MEATTEKRAEILCLPEVQAFFQANAGLSGAGRHGEGLRADPGRRNKRRRRSGNVATDKREGSSST